MSRSRSWCFTLNNPTATHFTQLSTFLRVNEAKYAWQEEIGSSGTHHIQGVLRLKEGKTFDRMKQLLPGSPHLEICRNWRKSVRYCNKAETRKEGTVPMTNIDPVAEDIEVSDPLAGKELFPWQAEVIDILAGDPDDRSIRWIWEAAGSTGKTTLAKHLCLTNKGSILYVSGKAADVKFAIASMKIKPRIVLWDIPRSSLGYVSFPAMEEVKQGIFFSGKYEAGMVILNPPHVLCFANQLPDRTQLSEDRWWVRRIEGGELVED